MPEPILDPDLPIIDPHHHLWDRTLLLGQLPPPTHPFEQIIRRVPRYLLDELLTDMGAGHNVIATVYMECGAFYRPDGPAHLKPVGEIEAVNGLAAIADNGVYGPAKPNAGIVGHADLTRGAAARETLEAQIAASRRFRGIRHSASHDPDSGVLGPLVRQPAGLYLDQTFRAGFAQLAPLGLSFDAWLLEPQLPDLIDLARAFPETQIILDHVGTPLGIASYTGRRNERFAVWRDNIRKLAELPNVAVKLGGLAMVFPGFPSCLADPPAPSTQLAEEWRPYLETCIEAFGPERGMFESNFPVDILSCSYATLWNAFKVFARGYSADEKTALFSGTASRIYKLNL